MKALPKVYFWLLCILLVSTALAQDQGDEEADVGNGGEGGAPATQEEENFASDSNSSGGEEGGDPSNNEADDDEEGGNAEASGDGDGNSSDREFSSQSGGHSAGRDDYSSGHSSSHHSEHSEHSEEHSGEYSDEHEEHSGDYEEGEEDEFSDESEDHSEEEIEHPQVEFDDYSEAEHMRSYKKISADMKVYEEEYSACIREIPDSGYTEEALDECLGKNFIKVTLDLKYIILKVMAKADTKVRQIFITHCYASAGTDEQFSTACDLMERDVIDMLWNGLDFVALADLNKQKYLDEWGEMPADTYNELFEELSKLSKEFFELLDELDSHKEITILRIKTLIDDRTKLILEEAQNHPDMIEPATVTHRIEISETVDNDDGSGIDFLPATQFHDGSVPLRNRKLPMTNTDGEKHNALRSLNSGHGYHELNGSNRQISTATRDRFQRNEQFKSTFWDRLGKAARAQARTPFKNIHTAHYSKFNK
jgi:hypothetical protein